MVMQAMEPIAGISSALEDTTKEYERMAASLNALLAELAGGGSGTHLVRHLDSVWDRTTMRRTGTDCAPSHLPPG